MITTSLERTETAFNRQIEPFPFTLKPQQEKALDKLRIFLQESANFFLLCGYAGTGKSTIVFQIVRELIAARKRVVLTAPTNKAVGILSKLAAENGLTSLTCMTVHQLLGLGMVTRGEKKVLQPINSTSIHLYDVVFLDECSMVGIELWQWIERCFQGSVLNQRKLILMGDPAQLNPVGEGRSPSFQVKNRAILTEVVRQLGESPILDFVTQARQFVKSKKEFFCPHSCYQSNDKSNGALRIKEESLLRYAVKKIKQEFASNPDCFRILCWTNKRVDYYNQSIRELVYGQDAADFLMGERLITKKPVVAPDGKTIILPTSTEITVLEVALSRHHGYQVWQLNVRAEGGIIRQIFVLHPCEQKRYQAELNRKLEMAKLHPLAWRKYYWFRDDLFAEVTNCFALTIHNSQGSTFDEGAVDGNDLLTRLCVGDDESYQQKLKEYHRLWYVGASRFRQRVFFIAPQPQRVKYFSI